MTTTDTDAPVLTELDALDDETATTDSTGPVSELDALDDPRPAPDAETDAEPEPDRPSRARLLATTARTRAAALAARVPGGRWTRRAVAAVLVLALLAGAGFAVYRWATALPDDAALRVADGVVTEQALDQRVRLYGALYGIAPPGDDAGRDTFRRDTAKAVAVSEVVVGEAAARGITVSEAEVSGQLDQLVTRSFPAGRDDFLARLSQVGIGERDVLDEVRRQMVTSRLYEQVVRDVPPVTDQDVARAYDERRATLTTPEQRQVRAIVLSSRDDADATLARLQAGADPAVEATRSLDQSTRGAGGDLGLLVRDQVAALDPGLADAVFTAAPGSFVGPVPLQQAWVVAQITGMRAGSPLTPDQARDPLRAQLGAERAGALWNTWTTDRLRDADVEYADGYRPADPFAAPAPR
ncbi:peptidylprolyl isomerase [Actinomycetospora flava]|uniref:Peptidyl-prolyl cis-trans isomerase n=1 Tax=Actinomycetospora flava TaxID=3129232 RepID=A0ABU8M2H4_9PSEU